MTTVSQKKYNDLAQIASNKQVEINILEARLNESACALTKTEDDLDRTISELRCSKDILNDVTEKANTQRTLIKAYRLVLRDMLCEE